MDGLRMAADDATRLEGWLVPFTGHLAGNRDSYQTRFSANTEYALDWFPAGRPLLYGHGLDAETGLTPVGRIDLLEVRDAGVWMQAQLDKQNEYFEAIRELVKAGKLYLSSGSVEHLVQIDARSGDMLRWPIVEGSLTPTPSNLHATIAARSAEAHYAAAGIVIPAATAEAIRAVWSQAEQDALPNSSFAYVEPGAGDDKSKRHLPYKDADGTPDKAHVANALARLDQTDIPDAAKAAARKKLMAAAKTLGMESDDGAARSAEIRAMDDATDATDGGAPNGISLTERSFQDIYQDIMDIINPPSLFGDSGGYHSIDALFPTHVIICTWDDDDGDGTYWDIPYTLGADLEPVLDQGASQQVEKGYVPVSARVAEMPLLSHATYAIRHVAALAASTKDYGERRFREGRMLSRANLKTISDAADGLEAHAAALRDLHNRAKGEADDAARAAVFADPVTLRARLKLLELATLL